MDQVALLGREDRAALFTETAIRLGWASGLIPEKDFWVCWTLRQLTTLPGLPRLLFKGGTSLSKGFGLIQRFSEDIDLGVAREDIGMAGNLDPAEQRSRKGRQRAVRQLSETVRHHVSERLLPALLEAFEDRLVEPFELFLGSHGVEAELHFEYPRALEREVYGSGGYVSSVVRLELGARSDHYPTREVIVRPYCHEVAPDLFREPDAWVIAQAPERTLLEKALILHSANSRGRMKPLSSRHAYDLCMMRRGEVLARVDRALYQQVAKHKLIFSDDKPASEAPESGIRLVPRGKLLAAFESDYRAMRPMFFRAPPTFAEILDDLAALEQAINDLV